jgi:hypothetical protein
VRAALLVALPVAVAGCAANVGSRASCDREAATTVVYTVEGEPAYIGQALLIQSCAGGGGFCHATDASDRFGAPAGLDFDAFPLRDTDAAALERLAAVQTTIHGSRNAIWGSVVSGTMPPGAAGRDHQSDAYWVPDATGELTLPIPTLDTAEGREALRNWLACGSPVVERSAPVPIACTSDADCAGSRLCDGARGICFGVGYVEPAYEVSFDPDFPSIYERILAPRCASATGCHGAEPRGVDLDLSSEAMARLSLVGVPASMRADLGASCGASGLTRVVPGDPDASLLVLKLGGEPDNPSAGCGDRMPSGASGLSPAAIAAIRQWITDGAM